MRTSDSISGTNQPPFSANYAAFLARTCRGVCHCLSLHVITVMYMQELTRLTQERSMDAYTALVPEIKWRANPVKLHEVLCARKVPL